MACECSLAFYLDSDKTDDELEVAFTMLKLSFSARVHLIEEQPNEKRRGRIG